MFGFDSLSIQNSRSLIQCESRDLNVFKESKTCQAGSRSGRKTGGGMWQGVKFTHYQPHSTAPQNGSRNVSLKIMKKTKRRLLKITMLQLILSSVKVLTNKKYVFLSGLFVLAIIFLLRNSFPGSLKSTSHLKTSNTKKVPVASFSEILKNEVPLRYKLDQGIILNLKRNDPDKLLQTILVRADEDKDKKLNEKELSLWIQVRIIDHLDTAIDDNIVTFRDYDVNHDGKMSWEEFFLKFMKEKGVQKDKALKLVRDHSSLSQSIKEELAMHKASWSQSEMSEPGYLNINEYLSFLHPEHNHVTLVNMVEELLNSLDDDGNEKVTVDEFINLSNKQDPNILADVWQEERRKEFNEIIDIDGNGVLMKRELLMYIDPKNPRRAIAEAKILLRACDKDTDEALSLEEMMNEKKTILDSKMVDVAKSFHAEF
ncbi:calcium-binding protein [Nymphon striatum]|nr:calcium-binding protein [Nymphon striatum]